MDVFTFLLIPLLLILMFLPILICYHSPRQSVEGMFGRRGQVNPGYNDWPKAFLHGLVFPILLILRTVVLGVLFVSLTLGLLLFLIILTGF